ncbi:MAG: hypothetical protein AB3N09_05055 [Tateyamaria sp.]
MKKMLAIVAVLAAGTGLSTAAHAESSVYDCQTASMENRGFIRERIVFSVDPATSTGAVADDLVITRYGKPIEADVKVLGNGNYRVKWDVKNLKDRANSFNLSYTLTYRPAEQKFSVRAIVKGFDNRPSGSGTCTVTKGRSLPIG